MYNDIERDILRGQRRKREDALDPCMNVSLGKELNEMDELNIVIQAISTVGFPIVMCGIMFWFLNKEQENHKAEMVELKDVISENNQVLAALKQLIEDKLQ